MNIIKKCLFCVFLFGTYIFVYGNNPDGSGHKSVKRDTLAIKVGALFALTGQNVTIGFKEGDLEWHYDQLEAFDSISRDPNYIMEIQKQLWARPMVIITGENITHFVCTGSNASLVNPDFSKCPSLRFLRLRIYETLNISKNIALEHLELLYCNLDSLELSHNINLKYLKVSSCRLNKLDVSKNTKLIYLNCESNFLTSLDLSQNTSLESVNCKSNLFMPLAIRDILYSLHGESPGKEKTIRIGSVFCYRVNNRIGNKEDLSEITFDLERITRKGWVIE